MSSRQFAGIILGIMIFAVGSSLGARYSNTVIINNELDFLAHEAYQYRSMSPMASYEGYKIPPLDWRVAIEAKYDVYTAKDAIVFVAVSNLPNGSIITAEYDGAGKRRYLIEVPKAKQS